MTLLKRSLEVWRDLSDKGWQQILSHAGLHLGDIREPEEFRRELLKQVEVNRGAPGFEDFAQEGNRGIEPGRPALSLLYHALASPGVLLPDGDQDDYPTPEQIQTIENLVFGIVPPALAELRQRAAGAPLAIVVFTSEYRIAAETPHKRHAEMCYSRTGLARVGNMPPRYIPEARGYLTFFEDKAQYADLAVLPCRYHAYIAAQMTCASDSFGPVPLQDGDDKRQCWVPMHKLFPGGGCLTDYDDLTLTLSAHLVNDKIQRVHRALRGEPLDTGAAVTDLDKTPFVMKSDLASFGDGALTPALHPVVEEARREDHSLVTLHTPVNRTPFQASLRIPPRVFSRTIRAGIRLREARTS